jgi:hypothetical protein
MGIGLPLEQELDESNKSCAKCWASQRGTQHGDTMSCFNVVDMRIAALKERDGSTEIFRVYA